MKNQVLSTPRTKRSAALRRAAFGFLTVVFLALTLGSSAAAQRDIRFLATADPQLENDPHATPGRWKKRVLTISTIYHLNNLLNSKKYRGLLVAGDLTQWALKEEWDNYQKIRKPNASLFYDGLGNHDMTIGNCCLGVRHSGYCTCPDDILKDMGRARESWQKVNGTLRRVPTKYKTKLSPHYSWDWDDVHFVQLNLYPGTKIRNEAALSDDIENPANLDPRGSLYFLQYDLLRNAADGRPVILIHHYCLPSSPDLCEDDRWWTSAQKEEYWKAIAKYNVVAIVTGHLHSPSDSNWAYSWPKPDPSLPGPAAIPTFIVGAALGGHFVDFHITDKSLRATRRQVTGTDWRLHVQLSGKTSCKEVPLAKGRAGTMTQVACPP